MGGKHKTRFDGLDVAAMTALIKRSLIGHKLANVYDGIALSASLGESSGKGTFLFKLANPSGSATSSANKNANSSATGNADGKTDGSTDTHSTTHSNRSMLLIESGVRFHTTSFYSSGESNNSSPPSQFAMKLRKHLRNLRLENIRQLGNLERVVDFRFGSGEYAHHLILELYGIGNIILTDDKYVILALLRVHEYNTTATVTTATTVSNNDDMKNDDAKEQVEQVKVRVGNVYPVTLATTMSTETSHTKDDKSNDQQLSRNNSNFMKTSILEMNGDESFEWAINQLQKYKKKITFENTNRSLLLDNESNKGKKKKKKNKDSSDGSTTLKTLLLKPNSGVFHYGPSLIEHCILCANLEPNTKFNLDTIESAMPPLHWERLVTSLKEEGSQILDRFNSGEGTGYVLYREKEMKNELDNNKSATSTLLESMRKIPHSDKVLEEFQPHLLRQHEDRPRIEYENFSMAVDEFYSLLEGQKRAQRAENAEQAARERLEKIKKDQYNRMEGLESEMMKLKQHAELVELHADDIDKAMGVINSAIHSGMDWEALSELVEVEKANLNPIALLIKKLLLEQDSIMVSLPDTANWDPDDEESLSIVDVTVSLKQGAYANARIMYEKYRVSKEKATKTAEAAEMALQAAEANAQKQIEQAQNNKNMMLSVMMQPQRKQHWFEKFHWFITSDNYIVIGGRDAQQNEILVKRYLRPGDAYLHADVHGAPTCVLRAKRRRTEKGSTEVLPLSDQALREAGSFAICMSSAWRSRMVTSAWWVESHQVSKTAPTGEYLTVGSFMIRGRKNFLPPSSLEMGLGVLFRLGDDVSVARHANERRDFALLKMDQQMDEEQNYISDKSSHRSVVLTSSKPDTESMEGESDIEEQNMHHTSNELEDFRKKYENKNESNGGTLPQMIEDQEDENKDDDALKEDSSKESKRKGFSARERKLIKKYGSLDAAEEILSKLKQEEDARISNSEKIERYDQKMPNNGKSQKNDVRGKKSKMKKIAKKYADQDEEDRELALLALQGSQKKKGKNNKGSKINNKLQSNISQAIAAETAALLVRDASEVVEKVPKDIKDILAKCLTGKGKSVPDTKDVKWDKLDAEVVEQLIGLETEEAQLAAVSRLLSLTETTRIDNYSGSLAGIIRTINKYGYEGIQLEQEGANDSKQRKTKAEKAAEKEAWREILAEDGIIEVDTQDGPIDDTAEISKLTGKPLPNDVILYALPVCAPYQVLAQYKYRVKLTPGSGKRGKSSKQCVELFCRTEENNSKNGKSTSDAPSSNYKLIELIKAVNDNEWAQNIRGDVKISAAGVSKAVKKQKVGAKKKKR